MAFGVKPPNQIQPAVQPKKTGTGFTNINRVLGANQGNKLGQNVAGGVQNQAQNVKTQTQQSQQAFNDEAQKNRLDTDEAKQKRDGTIGRFNESSYAPDMANFQVSSGLQQQYQTAKQNYDNTQKTNAEAAAQKQQADQAKLQQLQTQLANTPKPTQYTSPWLQGANANNNKAYEDLQKQISDLQAGMSTQQGFQPSSGNTALQNTLAAANKGYGKIDEDYNAAVAKEQEAYKQAEIQRLMGANVPTEQEIQDFTKFRTGTYTGPQELTDLQTLMGNAGEAQMLGDLTRSSGGRQELLRRFVGGDDYTQGQQRLDNLILGQDGTTDLNKARRSTTGLQQTISDANSVARGQAEEYKNRAKIFGEETVGKLNEARNPISTKVDERLKQIQDEENNRLDMFNNIQGTFNDTNENTKGLDRMTRLGLGLQEAMNAGYLTQEQANKLLGDNGLISRAESLKLDTNKLLTERLKNNAGKNINRGGAASGVQESQLSALDRLLGKTNTDVEFNQAGADYEKGNLGFDVDSLNDYITKSEAEKAQKDANYAAELEARNARYLNQSLANAQGAVGGGMQAVGAGLNQLLDPQAYVDPSKMGSNFADAGQGLGNAAIGGVNAGMQAQNAILEGLTKLNIGGQSIANTEGGRQLLKAIEMQSKLQNEAAGMASNFNSSIASGTKDLLKGDLRGIAGMTGVQGGYDAARQIAGNATKAVGGAVKSAGKAVKSVGKKLKKVFSDEDLKHDIKPADNKLYELLDRLNAHEYEYDDEVGEKGKHISVMAQELEKSDLGKKAVDNSNPKGKMVDYAELEPVQLAAMSSLHKRLKKLEGKE